jgi:hypothetical protein
MGRWMRLVLLGDFSFCLWDAGIRQLFCARDHFGVKPLYYARVGTTLICQQRPSQHPSSSASSRLASMTTRLVTSCWFARACIRAASFADIARVPRPIRCAVRCRRPPSASNVIGP